MVEVINWTGPLAGGWGSLGSLALCVSGAAVLGVGGWLAYGGWRWIAGKAATPRRRVKRIGG